jgi:hypothetical protein
VSDSHSPDEIAKLLGLKKDYPRLLAEVEALISMVPPRATIRHEIPENFEWFGRLSAVISE